MCFKNKEVKGLSSKGVHLGLGICVIKELISMFWNFWAIDLGGIWGRDVC